MTQTAIITGAGRGIGRAVAARLGLNGFGLVLVARSEAELAETARLAGPPAGRAEVVAADVGDAATAGLAVARALNAFGRLDVVVHCAGIAPLKPITDTTDDEFAAVMAANVTGFYQLARAAWPHMKRQGGGKLVAISSLAARDPFVGFSAYAAAKGAVNSLVLALDREGKPDGIRAYAVAPGAVETALLRSVVSTDGFSTEKTLSPEAVAEMVFSCVAGALQHCGGETIYLSK